MLRRLRLIADAAGAWRSARGGALVRGAGGASEGFLASGRTTFGFTGTGFCSGTIFAGSGFSGVGCCFCSGGATTSGFSCGGVGAICSCTGSAAAGSGGAASACCISGPGVMSIGAASGDDVIGARSIMMAGIATPGSGRCVYQFIASTISAACTVMIAIAETPQRRNTA